MCSHFALRCTWYNSLIQCYAYVLLEYRKSTVEQVAWCKYVYPTVRIVCIVSMTYSEYVVCVTSTVKPVQYLVQYQIPYQYDLYWVISETNRD